MVNGPELAPGCGPTGRSIERLLADLESVTAALASALGPEELDGWNSPEWSRLVAAHGRIRALSGRLDGLRYTLLPRIEDAGLWRTGMARTFASWLKVHEGVAGSTARKDVTTARRLAEALPATTAGLVAGDLGIDHARIMADVTPTSTGRTDALGWLIDVRTGHVVDPEAFVEQQVRERAQAAADAAEPDPVDAVDPVEPTVDPALADGTTDADTVLTVAISEGVLVTGEQALLAEAPRLDADRFRKAAAAFAELVDPDQTEKDTDKAKNGEFFELAKTFGGFHVAGFLTDEHGRLVQAAVQTVLGPPQAGDERTPTQRRAAGLADVARTLLDNGDIGTGAAVRPHLNVTVSFAELVTQLTRTRKGVCTTCGAQTGVAGVAPVPSGPRPSGPLGPSSPAAPPAAGALSTRALDGRSLLDPGVAEFTDSGGPVPASLLRRLACDAQVTRIVFSPDGAVLDVGRAQRTVSGQMRRAVIARDKHCVYVGCDQPPSRCEVHHAITHWADGGDTAVHNSALLCHYHHDLVDTRDITMRWSGKPTARGADDPQGAMDGASAGATGGAPAGAGPEHAGTLVSSGWTFTDRYGREITAPRVVQGTAVQGTAGGLRAAEGPEAARNAGSGRFSASRDGVSSRGGIVQDGDGGSGRGSSIRRAA